MTLKQKATIALTGAVALAGWAVHEENTHEAIRAELDNLQAQIEACVDPAQLEQALLQNNAEHMLLLEQLNKVRVAQGLDPINTGIAGYGIIKLEGE